MRTQTSIVAARPLRIDYGDPVETELAQLADAVETLPLSQTASSRWVAIKLLEQEPVTLAAVEGVSGGGPVAAEAREAAARVRAATGEDPSFLVADRRFDWSHQLANTAVRRVAAPRARTERLDNILTSRWFGIPIFLGLMWIVFKLVTGVAGPFVDWVGGLVAGPVSSLASACLDAVGLSGTWFKALIVGGIIAGVGSVVVFVPVLVVLYTALGVLEDSGYMARAAFLMDRVMRPIGLNGKSFLPLLLGFGCNVPGVYATRVLDRRRDRILTVLLMPFVTCAARLPIFVLLAGVFFPAARGTVVFLMYLASIAVVLVIGAVLDRLLLRGQRNASFVIELPPYRRPSLKVLRSYVAQRVRAFLSRAGTVILGCAMIVWLLLAIPISGSGGFADTPMQNSAFAGAARTAAPTLKPAGLGSYEVAGTLFTGFVAKEVVVSTLGQVYGTQGEQAPAGYHPVDDLVTSGKDFVGALRDAAVAVPGIVGINLAGSDDPDEAALAQPLRAGFDRSSDGHGALAAVAFLVCVLLYVPCMATVAAIRHELGTRWALASVGINLTVAWTAAVVIFQVGKALGIG
ncbi:MAG: ferrous iron transport protein B [Frankiaceae bacterium]